MDSMVKLHGDAYDEARRRVQEQGGPVEMCEAFGLCMTAQETTTQGILEEQWAEVTSGRAVEEMAAAIRAEAALRHETLTADEVDAEAYARAVRAIIGASFSYGVHFGLMLAQIREERRPPEHGWPNLRAVEVTVLAQCLDRPLRLGADQHAAAQELERVGLATSGVQGGQAAIYANDRGREFMRRRRAGEGGS